MINTQIDNEPFIFTSQDLVTDQRYMMDVGIGIGILYEVLEN
jgi:hypothetical protein